MIVCAKQEFASKPANTRNTADNLEHEANFIKILLFKFISFICVRFLPSFSQVESLSAERRTLLNCVFRRYEIHQNKGKEAHPGNAKGLGNQDSHCLVLVYDPISEDDSRGP